MNEKTEINPAQEAAAFQKIWMETMSKLAQSAFTFSPNSPPPEIMKQIRSGIFQALATSWEDFMRSPQFLEGMRQNMENAIAFRKMTNEFLGRARTEMQAPSKTDIDTVMLNVRHMEKRLLDRLDELSAQVARLSGEGKAAAGGGGARQTKPRKPTAKTRVRANGKGPNI
jgi:hypothetical protein